MNDRQNCLKGEGMNKISVCLMVLLVTAGGLFFSCSDNASEKQEKGAIEKMSDETAKKVSDKMLAPVEEAKEVKRMGENRLQDLQDMTQKEEAGK
jgi:hypothetical protein